MVFCGRPSKGCSLCRKRRIKCDLIQSGCSQCLRVSKVCEGYRDQLDLSFRDESEKVVSKVINKRQLEVSRTALSPTPRNLGDAYKEHLITFQALVFTHTGPLTYAIQDPNEDVGIKFFFTTFVTLLLDDHAAHGKPVPMVKHIIPWEELHKSEAMFNAVSSVGYAGLGNVTKEPKYTILARKRFASALKIIHAALKKPDRSELESIFKSVMLLSAFQLVSEPAGDPTDWSIHVEGGAALLQLMDAKRSRDIPIRQQLKLCLSVFSKYINKKEPCSPNILAWTNTCSESIDLSDRPAIALTRLLIAFTNLNASIGQALESEIPNLIAKVIVLDARLSLWEMQLPEAWHCSVVSRFNGDSVCGFTGNELIYRDLWTARIWNDYRWARICINDLIIRHTYDGDFMEIADAAQVFCSLQTNAELARGITNSISCEAKQRSVSTARGYFLLLHPLSVAASGIGVPEDVYQFAIGKLLGMGNDMGVKQALHLAETSIQQRREWKDLLHNWVD